MADEDVVAKKKRTLLEKYEVPINHLTYEYVETCNNGKELEHIVKILRSGEEGLYPNLVSCAEKRLKDIMPESRVLRVEEPVLTKNTLKPEFWNKVNHDLEEWSCEMKSREQELGTAPESLITADLPAIRSITSTSGANVRVEKKEENKVKSSFPRDYSEWDKYDADKELLKMDLEEEKRREEIERKLRLNNRNTGKVAELPRRNTFGGAGDYSNAEKHFLATQEKDRGNEYFKAREYKQAVDRYSASIAILPTPVAYNNRAMAYLKLENYMEAIMDCNTVLEQEPDNVKALHRRGVSHKESGNLQKALDDFLRILQLEPTNRLASSLVSEVRKMMDNRRKSVRMQIYEEDWDKPKASILDISSDENEYIPEPCVRDPTMTVNTSWPEPPSRKVKCNEFGFAKVMCNCSGVPDWVRQPPPKCLTCEEIKAKWKAEAAEKARMEKQQGLTGKSKGHESPLGSESEEEEEEEGPCEHIQEAAEATSAIEELSLGDTATVSAQPVSPFEFESALQAFRRSGEPGQLAPLLRRVDPAELPRLIGNKLDDTTLSAVLACLETSFTHNSSLVLKFLTSLADVPRFKIFSGFLEPHTKKVVARLLAGLAEQGCPAPPQLQEAYQL